MLPLEHSSRAEAAQGSLCKKNIDAWNIAIHHLKSTRLGRGCKRGIFCFQLVIPLGIDFYASLFFWGGAGGRDESVWETRIQTGRSGPPSERAKEEGKQVL